MLERLTQEDLPESYQDIVEYLGIEPFKKLVKLIEGSSIYIPKESSLTRPIRNRFIKKEFNGDYKLLSKKYDISQTQIRNILSSK